MRTETLAPTGVTISGTPLAEDPTALADVLPGLLAEHGFAVLRDQPLDDDQFLAFLQALGQLAFTAGEQPLAGYPDLNVISNVGRWGTDAPPRSSFHVDTSYVSQPPAYTALRAVVVPERGGATQFSDQYRAAETLPPDLLRQVEGRTITHVVTGVDPVDGETSADHPVLRPHPVTGRTALFLTTPARCLSVSGLDAAEGQDLVRRLFEHSTASDNVVSHRWAPDDLVVWDNAAVMHRGDHEGVVGDRVMHRGMVRDHARVDSA